MGESNLLTGMILDQSLGEGRQSTFELDDFNPTVASTRFDVGVLAAQSIQSYYRYRRPDM